MQGLANEGDPGGASKPARKAFTAANADHSARFFGNVMHENCLRHSTTTWRMSRSGRGLGEIRSSRTSFKSLGPVGTNNGKADGPERREVRPIEPCRFAHSAKGTRPLAEGELSLLQVVWQRNQVQIFNQPLASFASRFCPDGLPGQ